MRQVILKDLGLIDYQEAWDYQEKLFGEVMSLKLERREMQSGPALQDVKDSFLPKHYFLFCEHPAVITLGKSGKESHLLLNEQSLQQKGIDYYKINRGGDITFHGPGQIVGYPIFDLDYFFTDIRKFLHYLEEAVIRTLKEYGIIAGRLKEATGVWVDEDNAEKARKICAIGVRCGRWITMHGFAFNVNTELSYYDYIIPCGISGKGVTSLKEELGKVIDINEVKFKIKKHFCELFDIEFIDNEKS